MAVRKAILSYRVTLERNEEERFLTELRAGLPQLSLQLLSLRQMPSSRRIDMIGNQMIRALESNSLLAAKPELDLLLRFAGTTQISEAIEKIGYRSDGRRVLVAVGPKRELAKLERLARGDPGRFARSRTGKLSSADLEAIEAAALLGVARP